MEIQLVLTIELKYGSQLSKLNVGHNCQKCRSQMSNKKMTDVTQQKPKLQMYTICKTKCKQKFTKHTIQLLIYNDNFKWKCQFTLHFHKLQMLYIQVFTCTCTQHNQY